MTDEEATQWRILDRAKALLARSTHTGRRIQLRAIIGKATQTIWRLRRT